MIYKSSDEGKLGTDAGARIGSICMMESGKTFFLGVADNVKPGAIQLWRPTLTKYNVV